MQVEITVPVLPESVAEGTLGDWHKKVGDSVAVDENVVDLETEPHQTQRLCTIEELQDLGLLDLGAAGQRTQGHLFTEGRCLFEKLAVFPIEVPPLRRRRRAAPGRASRARRRPPWPGGRG